MVFQKGVDINVQGYNNGFALQAQCEDTRTESTVCTACKIGNEQMLPLLISNGANLNAEGKDHHCGRCTLPSPLPVAAANERWYSYL